MSNMYLPSQKVKEFLKYANNAGDQNWLLNRMNSIPVTVVEQLQNETNNKMYTKKMNKLHKLVLRRAQVKLMVLLPLNQLAIILLGLSVTCRHEGINYKIIAIGI